MSRGAAAGPGHVRVRRRATARLLPPLSSERLPARDVGPGTAKPESDTADHLAWRAAHAQPDQPPTRGTHAARADPHPWRPHDLWPRSALRKVASRPVAGGAPPDGGKPPPGPVPGSRPSRFPLSSAARLRTVTWPLAVGVQVKLQLSRPVAGCQLAPPSTDTSTPPTRPPPASAAVPLTVTGVPAVTVRVGGGGRRDRSRRIRRCAGSGQAGMRRRRLYRHVGEQVDRRLLHREARARSAAVMLAIEPPGPLHGAGTEHERVGTGTIRVAIQREVVRCVPESRRWSRSRAASPRRRPPWRTGARGRPGGRRCRDPRPTHSRRSRRQGLRCCPAPVRPRSCCATAGAGPPQPAPAAPRVPELTVKIVPVRAFSGRPPSAGGLNARVAPGAGPDPGSRVDLRVRVRLLVGDERAVRILPAGLPEDLVAAEERQMHARIARRLDIGALGAGPVLVMADREEGPVLSDFGAEPVAVDVR